MKRTAVVQFLAVASTAGWLIGGLGGAADAQEKVRWKLASSYGSQIDVLGQNIIRVIDNIKAMSDGNFVIQFNEPGALVPALEVFDAVSAGSVDASYTTTGFAAGKIPHLIFFASVPFGPNVNEYLAWIQGGGGKELYDEYYAEYNIKGFQCGIVVAESSGWFREPVEKIEDLQGLKMRFFGLGADVMQRLGVSTQLLAGGDIYPALERGVIDAAEFSYPSLDQAHGFYQIA
jgi:TRAP-type mannitol/chloroaromatic compound transport system substrate-binding protein